MKKVILLISILIILSNCAGYKPIFFNKDANFYISEIKSDDSGISRQITKNLDPYKNPNNKLNLNLELLSEKSEIVKSRDNKGDPQLFEMIVEVKVKISQENKIENQIFSESFTYNNQTNKFELSQYKKNIEVNLTNKIIENLIIKLNTY